MVASSTYRPLKVYAFDPSRGRSLGNYMTVRVPYEQVARGPRGAYLAVIDYDATSGVEYEAVDLDSREVMLDGGLFPSETDPRFHQQMVYAVASETIHLFERGLGRIVKWGFRRTKSVPPEEHRLRLFPHAMQEANAYYSRALQGIVFGYFPASAEDLGRNLPNQNIFTCLSHDIIAHETTHAIIDGQRRRFMENTNPDVAAFHEAFADIVALFQHFGYEEALVEAIQRTGGLLYRRQLAPTAAPAPEGPAIVAERQQQNPMIELAKQFGESMGMRAALREALDKDPDPTALDRITEAHERGSILVAAIFDAYFTAYMNDTADLFRIGRASGTVGPNNDLHPTLARRLAAEAAKLARRFSMMCIRAIDYCPPVDIRFGEFLRALITSDYEAYPEDTRQYRECLIEAFRLRGIRPEGVTSLSQEALLWEGIGTPLQCKGLAFDLLHGDSPEVLKQNAVMLHDFATTNAKAFSLHGKKLAIETFHTVIRVGDAVPRVEIVVEVIERSAEKAGSLDFDFFGGATLVLNADGSVRYVIHKSINDKGRLEQQSNYLTAQRAAMSGLEYAVPRQLPVTLDFGLIHRGF
jgi:hypothetical protein